MLDWLQSDAAYWTISITLLALGSLLLLRGMIGRRTRGKPLCRKCDYDLSGGVSATGTPGINLTCPECGHTHRKPRSPYHPRRFWKRAAIGLCMALLGGYLLFWPDVTYRRKTLDEPWYLAVVPTTAWIWLVPHLNEEQLRVLDRRYFDIDGLRSVVNAGASGGPGSDGTMITFEVFETREPRLIQGIWDWQKRLLAQRCIVALDEPISPRYWTEGANPDVQAAMYRQIARREHAANWLGGVSDVAPEARPALMRLAREPLPLGGEKAVAVESFQLVREPAEEDFALMIGALRDEDHEVRERAAATLGAWGKAEPAVVRALISHMSDRRMGNAVYELARLRPVNEEMLDALYTDLMENRLPMDFFPIVKLADAAVPRLIESLVGLSEPDPLQSDIWRGYAALHKLQSALSDIGAAAVPSLIPLLDHPDKRIVERAVHTLYLMEKQGLAAIPALQRLLHRSTDEDERDSTKETIREITEGSRFDHRLTR